MSDYIISMEDYRDAQGKFDWKSYDKARQDNGEQCPRCKGLIFPHQGVPTVCAGCMEMAQSRDQVDNDRMIRCPHCGKTSDVAKDELYDLYGEDWHNVNCEECNEDFAVQTHITYTFTSPAMVEKEEETDE